MQRTHPETADHRSRRQGPARPAARLWWFAGLCAMVLLLPGCLTDGSIPVGGGTANGRLRGIVVHAEQPTLPFPGARITLRSSKGLALQISSRDDGTFEFANVPDGTLEVTFDGAQPGVFLPVMVNVRTDYSSFSTIAVALEPARLSTTPVTAVSLTPKEPTVAVGQTLQLTAGIDGGDPLRKMPTWVVEGGVGSITPLGEFHAEVPGTGTLRAIAGNVAGETTVTVTP